MAKPINVVYDEDTYSTLEERICWELPIFYDPNTKNHAYFAVMSFSYNTDGSINKDSIYKEIQYNTYPSQENLDTLERLKNIDMNQYKSQKYYIDEAIKIHDLLKNYTDKHITSLRNWNDIEGYLKKRSQEEYDKIHTLEYEIEQRRYQIAYDRWMDECSGLMYKGAIIYTDEVSQNKLMGATIYALNSPEENYICRWKCKDGKFIDLNKEELVELSNLMRHHIQQCFNREEEALKKLYNCKHRDHVNDVYYEEVHKRLI